MVHHSMASRASSLQQSLLIHHKCVFKQTYRWSVLLLLPCLVTISSLISALKLDLTTAKKLTPSTAAAIFAEFPKLQSPELETFPPWKHRIRIKPDSIPSTSKLPFAKCDLVVKEVNSMEQQGIWEPESYTEWTHGMVMVSKPDGHVRVITDLSPLNKHVISIAILCLTSRISMLNWKTLRSSQNLTWRRLTTTSCLMKPVIPWQLQSQARVWSNTNAFQWGSRVLLQFSRELFLRLCTVFLALFLTLMTFWCLLNQFLNMTSGSTLFYNVCLTMISASTSANVNWGVPESRFWGRFEDGTISPDPKKIAAIQELKPPSTKRQVKSFLGMVNYLSDYIPNCSQLAFPL